MPDRKISSHTKKRVEKQFDDIVQTLARLALLCRVDLTKDANVRRVISGDSSVCEADNPAAFRRMREMLMLHYVARERSIEAIGTNETHDVVSGVVDRIREQFRRLGHGG